MLTVTKHKTFGAPKLTTFDVAFDASYAAGGEDLSAEDLVELVVFAALTRAGARLTSQATANGTSYIQQYQLALADLLDRLPASVRAGQPAPA